MCVRPSTAFYGSFSLGTDRSPGFGSAIHNSTRFSHSVSLRLRTFLVLNLARSCNSPDRSTKSTRSGLASLPASVNKGFQVLFHSPPGVLFTFPSQYCSTIGRQVVFRLGGWSPRLPAGFLVSRGTLDPAACLKISPTGFSPSLIGFPKTIRLSLGNDVRGPQPLKH